MRKLGWALTILGGLLILAGLSGAVLLGPDNRFTTGSQVVETSTSVIVTEPGVISYSGLQVDVLAEVPVNKPVFVGLGNSVDVQDYVGQTRRVEVSSFEAPWQVNSREVKGEDGLPGAPTAVDWWQSGSAGLGGASISTTLPPETSSLAIIAVGATNLSGLKVSYAYGIKGGFVGSLAVAALGGAGVLGGTATRRGDRLFATEDDDTAAPVAPVEQVEDVIYVLIDENGIEHEISAEEASMLESEGSVEVETGWDDAGRDDVGRDDAGLGSEAARSQGSGEPQASHDPEEGQKPGDNGDAGDAGSEVRPEDPAQIPAEEPSSVTTAAGDEVVEAADVGTALGSAEAAGYGPGEMTETLPQEAVLKAPDGPAPEGSGLEGSGPEQAESKLAAARCTSPTPSSVQPVIYVYVDDAGVEHEISADELDQYDIVDEEE